MVPLPSKLILSKEEAAIWEDYSACLWDMIPEPEVLVMLKMVRREYPHSYQRALNLALERDNPSPELIALAVAARLQGTTT